MIKIQIMSISIVTANMSHFTRFLIILFVLISVTSSYPYEGRPNSFGQFIDKNSNNGNC